MNTPQTDKQATGIIGFYSCETVPASFARKLEHERDEARDQRDAITIRLGQTQEHLIDARRSAEQWRAVAAKYAGCTENECNRLPWDSLHNAKGVATPACTLKNDPTASTESPRPAC